MPRYIRIELYDHTSDEEIADILADLVAIGIDSAELVSDDA